MTPDRAIALLALATSCLIGCATRHAAHDSAPSGEVIAAHDAAFAEVMDRYYLSACPMCGTLLGARGEAVELVHEGRELRFCNVRCRDDFARDPRVGLGRVDALMIADQRPHYPLDVSVIDARPLGSVPIEFIWGNRLFRAADARDRDAILADPAGALRALDRAVLDAQRPSYGMPDTCPVQGDILESDRRIDLVVANRMVRVCCARCARVVRARPFQYLTMVDYANRRQTKRLPDAKERP